MAFSASDAAFEGFRLARRAPKAIAVWALAYILFTAAAFAVAGGSFMAMMDAATQVQGATDPSDPAFQQLMGAYLSLWWMLPLSLVFGSVVYTAVNRAVIRPAEKGFGYLKLGMDEVRVFVVCVVLTVLAMVVGAVVFGVAGVVVGFGAAVAGDFAGLLVFVILVAAAVLCIWLAVRFSLAIPITFDQQRIAIFDSWGVTKGRSLGLFGMTVIVFVMAFVVSILASIILLPIMFFSGGGMTQLAGMASMDFSQIMSAMGPAIVVYIIYNGVVSALTLAIIYAPYAAAYRDITGRGAAPEVETVA